MTYANRIRSLGVVAAAMALAGPVMAEEPAAPELEFVFEETVTLGPSIAPGKTPLGGRNIIPITGGTFEGPGLRGEVLPGGWDWQLLREDGCLNIVADYFLKTDDGVVINVRNTGVACRPTEDNPRPPIRTHPVFEAPEGKYGWLNRAMFVGTLVPGGDPASPAVKIRFYQVK